MNSNVVFSQRIAFSPTAAVGYSMEAEEKRVTCNVKTLCLTIQSKVVKIYPKR